MTFKFYDSANDVVIDLNESYTFTSNDVVGDGFNPLILSGISVVCEDDNEAVSYTHLTLPTKRIV